ncbi:MAG TPA: hypothetical protein VHG93_25335 [Longimicrobium sp.]|nr:hypothetical protein [Longimicrobium sp.]
MKTVRCLLAAAVMLAAAACSGSVTAPDAALHAPGEAALEESPTSATTPTTPAAGEDDSGLIGSGVGR